jgi:hypothetical protein
LLIVLTDRRYFARECSSHSPDRPPFCYRPLQCPARRPGSSTACRAGLFGPLGDPHAELYWELLAELYRLQFEREPFLVIRSAALDVAEGVIRGS